MTKLCSVCGTENREDAKFCRACGTAFTAAAARPAGDGAGAALNICPECGFQNKPGLRYCANCGMSLAGTAPAEGSGTAMPAGTTGGSGPPPISYPSFATVAPYPPAPAEPQTVPDIPDPDAAIAVRRQRTEQSVGKTTPFGAGAPQHSRAPLLIGVGAAALVLAGALAWRYMRDADPSPPMIGVTTAPVAPTVPAASVAGAPVVVEATPASAPQAITTSASAVETPPSAAPATAAGALGAPPAAAQPLPKIGDPVPPDSAADIDAKRVAAEKRRERVAREKAERDAKVVAEQRDQTAAAAQRAEQEAARRRIEEAQRSRAAAAVPPVPVPVAAQPRGVREVCAGRGTIAEAVCQSRECGRAEHANEPICRQLREQDERRRNMLP
jgi:hypothetical protein